MIVARHILLFALLGPVLAWLLLIIPYILVVLYTSAKFSQPTGPMLSIGAIGFTIFVAYWFGLLPSATAGALIGLKRASITQIPTAVAGAVSGLAAALLWPLLLDYGYCLSTNKCATMIPPSFEARLRAVASLPSAFFFILAMIITPICSRLSDRLIRGFNVK